MRPDPQPAFPQALLERGKRRLLLNCRHYFARALCQGRLHPRHGAGLVFYQLRHVVLLLVQRRVYHGTGLAAPQRQLQRGMLLIGRHVHRVAL